VLFIEVAAYGSNTISPDAEHVTFKLENGRALKITCPPQPVAHPRHLSVLTSKPPRSNRWAVDAPRVDQHQTTRSTLVDSYRVAGSGCIRWFNCTVAGSRVQGQMTRGYRVHRG